MRLFIAIEFEKEIIQALTDLSEELKKNGVTGRFTPPENLHMTLAFIGEYGNPEEVLDVMKDVPFEPFDMELEGLQHFRDMLFVRISDNPSLTTYVKRLRRKLAKQGIPFDKKRFSPHITLARKVSFQKGVKGIPVSIPGMDTNVESVSLFRSDRGKQGMIYRELGSVESWY